MGDHTRRVGGGVADAGLDRLVAVDGDIVGGDFLAFVLEDRGVDGGAVDGGLKGALDVGRVALRADAAVDEIGQREEGAAGADFLDDFLGQLRRSGLWSACGSPASWFWWVDHRGVIDVFFRGAAHAGRAG